MAKTHLEHFHQVKVVGQARLLAAGIHPDFPGLAVPALELLHAIPNGGKRDKITAGNLVLEGVLAGVPDLMLPVARQGFHGLYLEMKKPKDYKVADNQVKIISRLRAEGYRVEVGVGWLEAWNILLDYIFSPVPDFTGTTYKPKGKGQP